MSERRIEEAILAMANLNRDYAATLNGVGFSKTDTAFGMSLAQQAREGIKEFTGKQANAAVRMLIKYARTQLAPMGFDIEALKGEAAIRLAAQEATLKKREDGNGNMHYLEVIAGKDEVRLVSPFYRRDMVAHIKDMPGTSKRWDAVSKQWVFRADVETIPAIRKLAATFDLKIIGVERLDAIENQIELRIESSVSSDTDYEPDAPEGQSFWGFQKAGIKHLIDVMPQHNGFLADEMGLGKTVQALGYMRAAGSFPALLVVPNVAKLQWARHVAKWLPGRTCRVLNGGKPMEGAIRHADVVILNYDILAKWADTLMTRKWALMVLDESHFVKNREAQRTKKVAGHKPKGKEYEPGLADVADQVLLLTGTPVLNRTDELIQPLRILGWLGRRDAPLGTISHFLAEYGGQPEPFGGYDGKVAPEKLVELNRKMRALGYIRREKRDYRQPDGTLVEGVMRDLPEVIPAVMPLEISDWARYRLIEGSLREHYKSKADRDKELLAMLEKLDPSEREDARRRYIDGATARAEKARTLVLIEACKQEALRQKLDGVEAWVDEFLESSEDKKLLLFVHHQEVGQRLAARYNAPMIVGGMGAEARLAAEEAFQTDPDTRVIVLSIMAASMALTLTAATDVAIVELPWRPGDVEQAIGRAYGRVNDPHGVTAWYLVAAGTVEEHIAGLLDAKRLITSALNRGVPSEEEALIDLLGKALLDEGGDDA